jgi:uncharacterized protein (DUF4415 family)
MKKNYDLKKLKWKVNPYLRLMKTPVTMRVDLDVLGYFRVLGKREGVPYQALINQFLRFCKDKGFKPKKAWKKKRVA